MSPKEMRSSLPLLAIAWARTASISRLDESTAMRWACSSVMALFGPVGATLRVVELSPSLTDHRRWRGLGFYQVGFDRGDERLQRRPLQRAPQRRVGIFAELQRRVGELRLPARRTGHRPCATEPCSPSLPCALPEVERSSLALLLPNIRSGDDSAIVGRKRRGSLRSAPRLGSGDAVSRSCVGTRRSRRVGAVLDSPTSGLSL